MSRCDVDISGLGGIWDGPTHTSIDVTSVLTGPQWRMSEKSDTKESDNDHVLSDAVDASSRRKRRNNFEVLQERTVTLGSGKSFTFPNELQV